LPLILGSYPSDYVRIFNTDPEAWDHLLVHGAVGWVADIGQMFTM
jgi:hypothetical protein